MFREWIKRTVIGETIIKMIVCSIPKIILVSSLKLELKEFKGFTILFNSLNPIKKYLVFPIQ